MAQTACLVCLVGSFSIEAPCSHFIDTFKDYITLYILLSIVHIT
jgi:hypothetical protein